MQNDFEGKQVFVYARVSTTRQERNDLSLPDQISSAERWIDENGAACVRVFSEAGSATDDDRRAFRQMIALAESDEHPVDIILVHSLSRLFRNALDFMQYRERLRRRKVRIVSITQAFGDNPAADMAVGMLALFDEYHSAENGKHVRRTMIANAAAGYWNGQTPPLGFRTYVVPQPRGKDRKKLEHDPETVDLVRLIFDTYLHGTAEGPIGITGLAQYLNERGERIRGKRFSISNLHAILTNTAYIGYVMFNRRDSRTGETRPEGEWVPIPVPPIVTEDVFYAARKQMADRDPRMGEAAVKTNTRLLTKLAVCGCGGDGCGAGMMTVTGKSGRYAYYGCAARVKQGPDACQGRRVPMELLDGIVLEAVAEQLTQPERLHALLQSWLDRSATAVAEREDQLKRLRARITQLEGESASVIKLVRNGICSPDDPQIATELNNIRAQRTSAEADIAVLERQLEIGDRRITPAIVSQFGELLRRKLSGPDPKLRREYVHLLVDRVEVGDRDIRISGQNSALQRALVASQTLGAMVPKAERKWRARQGSNL
ncbi:recombinase family protein [Novosphingobium sp. PhB57]|uniref:recombinase family protein n=1 Tax=Novosphingobium sp. PhB57 TaxID=2485107 RepID=UPI001046EDEE|nr:recombinase family protein [Novosphingobium sp. PhB57]